MKLLKLVLLGFLSFNIIGCYSRKKDSFEDPVVSVNAHVLSGVDFSKTLVRKFLEQDIKYPKPEIINILKKQIIEDFILQAIFNDYAASENLLVKKELLDAEFEKFKNSYPDKDSFDIFLNESGQNKTSFRLLLKDRLLRSLVKDHLFAKQNFNIEPKSINDYYNSNKDQFKTNDQIKVKQIVIESEEEGVKVQELLKRTKSTSFESLAEKYSLGPEKANGGDLGWVEVSSFSAFEEANKTPVGQITGIIKSENAYHIFKVLDKKKAATLTLKEAEDKIKNSLLDEQKNKFLENWIKEKTKSSKIVVNGDLIKNITVTRPTSI